MIDPTDRPVYGALHAPSVEPVEAPHRRRGVLPWLVAAVAFAFALGLLTNPWFDRNIRARLPGSLRMAESTATPELKALQARLAALESRPAPMVGTPSSVPPAPAPADAATEARIIELQAEVGELRERVDSSIATAADGAERAQAALLVAALRRAVDSGQRFDAYEPALRARFGTTHPNEVADLLAFTRRPVSTEQLADSLVGLAPAIDRAEAEGRSWWASLKAGVAGVVAVRRADAGAVDPQGQLQTAALRVRAGDVEGALRRFAAMPPGPRQALAGWAVEARRYVAAEQALQSIEVAALAAPAVAAPAPDNL